MTKKSAKKGIYLEKLTPQEAAFFRKVVLEKRKAREPLVLWGWKRDLVIDCKRYPESRTIYFSADLGEKSGKLFIKRAYFFLDTRAKRKEIDILRKAIGNSRTVDGYKMEVSSWKEKKHKRYSRLRIEIGKPTEYDQRATKRRLRGKPRLFLTPPRLIRESKSYDISSWAPLVLCCGSGLSAESRLPFLGKIHNLFEVDNQRTGELIFGARDGLPARLVKNVRKEFEKFCQFTIKTIKARPAKSHKLIVRLYKKGTVRQLFTDNMDDLFRKVGIPYTQTRLSIFPDRFPTKFDPKVKGLLVIGVAVDRRDVIKQARKAGLKIIVINPVYGVAPHSRNMDYLCKGDIFFREEAAEALPKIVSASGF